MALHISFKAEKMSAATYDEILRRLDTAGQGSPAGRLYHSAYGDRASLQVVDIWASPEQFQAFGAVLMPILGAMGVSVVPDVQPQYNAITGM